MGVSGLKDNVTKKTEKVQMPLFSLDFFGKLALTDPLEIKNEQTLTVFLENSPKLQTE